MKLMNRTFDELTPGDVAEMDRLITLDDLYVFAAASGNYNPMHLPAEDGDVDGTAERVAPGMFVGALISAVLGMRLPGPGTLYRRQVLDFHDRAHAGEDLRCTVKVLEKRADGVVRLATEVRRIRDDALIVSGEAEVIAPKTRFDSDNVETPGLVVQRHRHFDALLERAHALPPVPTAVVAPDDPNSLGGALLAAREKLIVPIFVGRGDDIHRAATEAGMDISAFELIDVPGGDKLAAARACQLVHEGRAAAVMKGHLHTDDLLVPMLDKANGLRIGRRFTHVFVMDVPGQPHPAIQSSIDAAALSKMADRGQITGGLVDGPLAMDNAVDVAAAKTKGLTGGVAGQANILVVPGLDAGNMLAKQLSFISHAEGAGLLLGAKVPVVLNSRSDGAKSRLASCAVAALHHAAQTHALPT